MCTSFLLFFSWFEKHRFPKYVTFWCLNLYFSAIKYLSHTQTHPLAFSVSPYLYAIEHVVVFYRDVIVAWSDINTFAHFCVKNPPGAQRPFANDGGTSTNSGGSYGLSELEQVLKQKTFTRCALAGYSLLPLMLFWGHAVVVGFTFVQLCMHLTACLCVLVKRQHNINGRPSSLCYFAAYGT